MIDLRPTAASRPGPSAVGRRLKVRYRAGLTDTVRPRRLLRALEKYLKLYKFKT